MFMPVHGMFGNTILPFPPPRFEHASFWKSKKYTSN